jgi:hypothetical protein
MLCAAESDYNHYVLFSRVLDTVVCAYTLIEQEGCIIVTRMMHDNEMEFSSQTVSNLNFSFLAY